MAMLVVPVSTMFTACVSCCMLHYLMLWARVCEKEVAACRIAHLPTAVTSKHSPIYHAIPFKIHFVWLAFSPVHFQYHCICVSNSNYSLSRCAGLHVICVRRGRVTKPDLTL